MPEPCRAKLNLFLDVVGRRADGYHDLVTVFHEIDLADELTVEVVDARSREFGVPPSGGRSSSQSPATAARVRLSVEPASSDVPADATNLAARAAAALLERAPGRGVSLHLKKRIPVGGGLGGGSADAAGALRAVNASLGLGLDADALRAIGATLGSDVPFLVEGGTALGRGRGERLEPVAAKPMDFLLLVPTFGASTAAVYRALPRDLPPPRDPRPVLDALAAGDAVALGRLASNALFAPACAVEPRLGEVMAAARVAFGPRVHLTGSGSTFFVPLRPGEPTPRPGIVPHLRTSLRVRSRA